ncbi:trypsin-3-like [Culicoides brevitarsis]|uniref:trypsin-3-like n=1 Tax=Culicoides brevitarsis TaxID=469753 RepID=UPI00307B8437
MIKVLFLTCCVVSLAFANPLSNPLFNPRNRIVGGTEVEIEDFPYQIALLAWGGQICGGAIVNEDTIITAAHCSQYGVSSYSIRAGSKSQYTGGIVIDVSNVFIHERYSSSTFDNDVAIMKLSKPLTFSSQIQPIRLAQKGYVIPDGTYVTVSGWGDIASGAGQYPEFLRAVDVPVVNQKVCDAAYGGITERMICAGIKSKDSCQGDSGGPLVYNGYHIGVVSFGYGCAFEGYPGVYSRTSELREFIDKHT